MTHELPVVHVVEDDTSVRTALTRLLRAAGHEVRTYGSAGEFLMGATADQPGCVVLDVNLPGPSGLELHRALIRRNDPLPVIFLTGHGDVQMGVSAMKAGAVDFLTKPVDKRALLGAIDTALARGAASRMKKSGLDVLRARYESLTAREREVCAGVVAGKINKLIASELGTSERTIKAHRARVMEKMQVGSLAELVHIADQLAAAN